MIESRFDREAERIGQICKGLAVAADVGVGNVHHEKNVPDFVDVSFNSVPLTAVEGLLMGVYSAFSDRSVEGVEVRVSIEVTVDGERG